MSSFADGTRTVVHRTAQGRAKVWELSRGPTAEKPQRLEALTVKQVTSTAPDGSYALGHDQMRLRKSVESAGH